MRDYTVGDCFYQIRNGANIKQGDIAGGYPITRIETTTNNTFNRDRMGYAGITDLSKYESYVLEDGDLLMSHINSVQYLGRTVLYKKQEDETIIHGMNLLSLKANREIILPEFACYSFRSDSFKKQLSKITKKSVNQASFTVADLKKITLSVPSLNEQKEIVQTLDKCQLIDAKRKQQLSALDDLIKARFVEMFGDPVSIQGKKEKISDAGKVYTGNTPSMKVTDYYETEDIPFIKPGDIAENGVTLVRHVNSFISEKGRSVARVMPKGSILVTCIGTIGKVGIAAQESCCNQQINFIVPNDRYNSFYLAYCLTFFKDVLTEMANAPVVPIINKSQFSTLEIPVVPKVEQEAFAAFVAQVDKSKVAVQKALDEAQLLFDSLMQQFFSVR